mmetsp:Transcript_3739/g.5100  ORF Transcript_3739/g.5100 Transcript_3739/m.5100 type:complete len:424 (-) Transcript_3739:210-1481(-)
MYTHLESQSETSLEETGLHSTCRTDIIHNAPAELDGVNVEGQRRMDHSKVWCQPSDDENDDEGSSSSGSAGGSQPLQRQQMDFQKMYEELLIENQRIKREMMLLRQAKDNEKDNLKVACRVVGERFQYGHDGDMTEMVSFLSSNHKDVSESERDIEMDSDDVHDLNSKHSTLTLSTESENSCSSYESLKLSPDFGSRMGRFQFMKFLGINDWLMENESGIGNDEEDIGDDGAKMSIKDRSSCLVMLLIFQSCSGFILGGHENLLRAHPAIVYFLTMLVGAGGNAGNQASVQMIRAMALGKTNDRNWVPYVMNEIKVAVILSVILSAVGCIRAIFFSTPLPETIAVTVILAVIVFTSIIIGVTLPLALNRIGIDPVHSSTTIQVIMDILGVFLTVVISTWLLQSPNNSQASSADDIFDRRLLKY